MKNIIRITLSLLVAFNVHAQNSGNAAGCVANPPDFSKMSYQEASQAVNDELRKKLCPEYARNLTEEIQYGNLGNNKAPAIYLLGELHPHDNASIEILIENIDLKSPPTPLLAPLLWKQYPAEEALMKIGTPTVNPILEHLPTETNELRRQLMCEVLRRVESKVTEATYAQNLVTTSDCITNPPDFSKLSYEEANTAVESEDDLVGRGVKKICPEYIANLVNQLRSEQLSGDNKTLVVYLLGELHPNDTNSIQVLIENIDFKATKFDRILKTRISILRWGDYPAQEALIKIGKSVVDPILNYLPSETSELRRQLMCDVLKKVIQRNS